MAIVQARMGSSRLPGKVLLDLAGEPMLARVVVRLCRAKTVDAVVVATTVEPADQAVADLCAARCWPHTRGSEADVLDRYHAAAIEHRADVVVRVTADCPMIDPAVVDQVVRALLDRLPAIDYASNVVPTRSFPHGLDVEAFTAAALDRAWREDANPAWREHVTPYLYRRPDLFRAHCVVHPVDHGAVRWTVDTPADFARAEAIYKHFGHDRFTWAEALAADQAHPEWAIINRDVRQRTVD
ncbi:MAG: glycosyltransferase family protein [Gemmataceae bacterium]